MDGGSFQLLYIGPTSPSFFVLAEGGATVVTVLGNDTSVTSTHSASDIVAAGDFLRIDGDLYEIAAVSGHNVTLTDEYTGKGGDGKTVLTAYYANLQSQCIGYNATANDVETYIETYLFDDVPFAETVTVSVDNNISDGQTYRITFDGAAFTEDMYPLGVVSHLAPYYR